ncbi:MAG: 3-phosphoshikimate 1-carboxyvinyltransferase, partial [Candidatus Saganbacteria bacterium]|nr:3-phosphoshikimate 1-carboxyvinyltransferase [Candidatus Saganbacteria bacterium]
MASLKIKPASKLSGEIHVPGDKSISHRAVMLGSIAEGETQVEGFLAGKDCLATVECFKQLGLQLSAIGSRLSIQGKGLRGLKKP